ncbi:MAG: hypothetical protein ACQESL_03095, partial [Bacteroidota bacterium]
GDVRRANGTEQLKQNQATFFATRLVRQMDPQPGSDGTSIFGKHILNPECGLTFGLNKNP